MRRFGWNISGIVASGTVAKKMRDKHIKVILYVILLLHGSDLQCL